MNGGGERWPVAATIVESTGVGDFQVLVRARGTTFFADEPIEVGGLGSGPSPFELLGIALASCTAMTLRLYARMKHIPLQGLQVEVTHVKDAANPVPDRFTRLIRIDGSLAEDARARLLEIAERCPVHRTLIRGARIETRLETC